MIFAIKAEVNGPCAETLTFIGQRTMYGGKHIAKGVTVFVFASENEGGPAINAGYGDTILVIVDLPDTAVKESRDRQVLSGQSLR